MKNRNLVYSTDQGRLCPGCEQPASECQCKKEDPIGSGKVLIALETKGRKGKRVKFWVRDKRRSERTRLLFIRSNNSLSR